MRIAALLLGALLLPVAGCGQDQTGETAAPPAATEQPEAPEAAAQPPGGTAEPAAENAPQTLATGEGVPAETEVAPPTQVAQGAPATTAPTDAPFREGTHYRVLAPTQPTSSPPDKIEVAEVFWYGCAHCYAFEPTVQAWAESKAGDVTFVRIPAMWNPTLVIHARAFYTAEALGVFERVHDALFTAMHEQSRRLLTEEELADFFAQYGVEKQAFRNAFESFAVETALQRADQLNRRYRISSTPTMIINGKYVTGPQMTNGFDNLMAVVDFLVQRERTER